MQFVLFLINSVLDAIIFIGESVRLTMSFLLRAAKFIFRTILLDLSRMIEGVTIVVSKSSKKGKASISSFAKGFYLYTKKIIITFGSALFNVLLSVARLVARVPFLVLYTGKELYRTAIWILEYSFQIFHSFISFLTSRYFRFFLYGIGFTIIVIIGYQSYVFVYSLPSPRSIGKVNFAQSTHLYDRNQKLLYEIYRDVNRTPVQLSEIPEHVIEAAIAIEDKNFYEHKGVSFFGGILRAVKDTIKTNELQGGSTITQQLIKTSLLTPERTVERKVKEIILAVWAEQLFTKNEILEMYLNQVPYGGSAYGIQEASKIFFGKNVGELKLEEAALLAGVTRAPTFYSPYTNPDAAITRRNRVLYQMESLGFITPQEYRLAVGKQLVVNDPTTNIRAGHFAFYTKSYLEREFGKKKVEEGGLQVTTTLDLEIQEKAEKILNEELDKVAQLNVSNGGILVLDSQTGAILAMVGSRDFHAKPYGAFNTTTALRQPGSSLKPMLYAYALEKGYTAATPINDAPIVFPNPGGVPYAPVNYDGRYHGVVPLRYALANSYNIPAVLTLQYVGVEPFIHHAETMGIDTWTDTERFGLSLSLGGGEVTMLDLAQVYMVFASGGYRIEPTPVLEINDTNDRLIERLNPQRAKVLNDGIAFIITDILSDNVARTPAFGPNSSLNIPNYQVAVKTGTTDYKKDNWTAGYTNEFTVIVWVGNNDNSPMSNISSGITGAAPIWNRVMTYLLEEKSTNYKPYEKPNSVVSQPCYGNRQEYFLTGTQGRVYCNFGVVRPKNNDAGSRPSPHLEANQSN